MTGKELVNYEQRMLADAAAYAEQEPLGSGTFISTRGGVLTFGEEQLPGNQLCAVVLDAVWENTYYRERWSEDNPQAPTCYAFGRNDGEMAPHPSMQADPEYFTPESAQCNGCAHNVWGSADQGRGKACQNRRRLALLPAGIFKPKRGSRDFDLELFTDPRHFQQADIAMLKLPTTSTKEWAKYVQGVAANTNRPPYGVITHIFLEPHPKHQFHVKFEQLDTLPDDLAQVIIARHEEAKANIITPYTRPQERDAAPTAGGLRGLRR